MCNKVFIGLVFLLGASSLWAQSSDTVSIPPAGRPLMIVKWAPLSLLDADNTLQLGMEYLFKAPFSAQQEVGYGWFNFNDNQDIHGNVFKSRQIWRLRSEFRYYFEDKYIDKPRGTYLGLEFLYKRVNYLREGTVGRECMNSPCQYFQISNYKILKDVIGLHGKVGWQFLIENRLVIDLYLGGGLRNVLVKWKGKPLEDNSFNDFTMFVSGPIEPGKYSLVSISAGFKLGYLFYRKNQN